MPDNPNVKTESGRRHFLQSVFSGAVLGMAAQAGMEFAAPAMLSAQSNLTPEAALQARTALAAASVDDLEALADRFLQGDVKASEAAEMVFVAAALQVAWTRMAALFEAASSMGWRFSESRPWLYCATAHAER